MTERIVATSVRGRYLAVPPGTPGPAPILVGFHGYAEDAETQLARLSAIPESDRWLIVSIQGLHRFYRHRTNRVVASWMTRQDRENAIADNIAYVSRCLDAVASEWPTLPTLVFAGFSQGVGMAFRAAVNDTHGEAAVIAVGGDIPPEITQRDLGRLPKALLARGNSDYLYKEQQFAADERRLRDASVGVLAITLQAGHEWSGDLVVAASQFLRERLSSMHPPYGRRYPG